MTGGVASGNSRCRVAVARPRRIARKTRRARRSDCEIAYRVFHIDFHGLQIAGGIASARIAGMKFELISLARLARAIVRRHRVHHRLHRGSPDLLPPSSFVPLTGE
jgi:hypothetical protein